MNSAVKPSLRQQANCKALIQQISQLDERRSEAQADLAKLPSDHASEIADLHSSVDQLDQRRIDIKSGDAFTITAPIAGRVTAVQAMAGRSTDTHLPLLTIVPQGAAMQGNAVCTLPGNRHGLRRSNVLIIDGYPPALFRNRFST